MSFAGFWLSVVGGPSQQLGAPFYQPAVLVEPKVVVLVMIEERFG